MPMPEKKRKKISFSEDEADTLTKRYGTITVLTLLQEMAHYPHAKKIDWNELVRKTSTGISNAREYRMLWRHLAYGSDLPETFEEGAQPMDEDSDLDCEHETLPSVSAESASDTTAFVKVMMASRTLSESTPSSSTIEVPLIVNVPVFHSSRNLENSSHPSNLLVGTSIIFPVTVQRQTLPTISSADGIETKGSVGGSMASKRKRKAWSEEDDLLLRDAVQKLGEGNWATIAKGDTFPIKRSATQLAQRWSALRKKDGSASSGTVVTNPQSQYTTAEQLATRHSLSLALDMTPFKKLTSSGLNGPVRTSASIKNEVKPYNVSTVRGSVPPQRPSQQALLASGKTASKCNSISDRELKPTTVHSGAQTVSQSTVSQFKVAQPKKTVDTVGVGSSLTKTSISTGLPSDQKDKHVISVVDKVAVKQEVKIPDRDLKPTIVHSGAQIVSQSSTVLQAKAAPPKITGSSLTKAPISTGLPSNQKDIHFTSMVNEVLLKRELKPTTVHSGAQTVSQSNTVSQFKSSQAKNAVGTMPIGGSLIKTSISAGLPPNQKDKHDTSVVDKVMLKQEVKISDRELKPTTNTVHSGAQTVSQSNTVSQFKVSPAKNAVDTVPVGSSLTKTSISAGLPPNQKDKQVTFVVDEVLLKQEVNPTKDLSVSKHGSAPKGDIQKNVASTVTTHSQANGKGMPSEKKMEHKADSENAGGCEEQARVTNSNFTSKNEGTENGNENLDQGNQDLDQDKGANTINGSSDHQNMNEKSVKLPVQDECSQGLELQDSKN